MGFKPLFGEDTIDYNGPGAIHLYTDGSCLRNGAPDAACGWAYLLIQIGNDDIKWTNSGGWRGGTNNQAEMAAVLYGLQASQPASFTLPITVYSDSKYVIETLKGNFRINKNQGLWTELFKEVRKCENIRFEWVKGHANDLYNIEVDRLATQESVKYDQSQ